MNSLTSKATNNIGDILTAMSLEVTCSLCQSLFDTPTVTHCKHLFCSSCIKRSVEESGKCPACQGPLEIDQLRESTRLQLIVTEIKDMQKIYQQSTAIDPSQIAPQRLTEQQSIPSTQVKSDNQGMSLLKAKHDDEAHDSL
ncbi:hypothetical protein BD560DRAFT_160011 [Blakeslea trispora]|nr:hypothetical protein BD560DRAFT_160011 [Blakeslea trispora]